MLHKVYENFSCSNKPGFRIVLARNWNLFSISKTFTLTMSLDFPDFLLYLLNGNENIIQENDYLIMLSLKMIVMEGNLPYSILEPSPPATLDLPARRISRSPCQWIIFHRNFLVVSSLPHSVDICFSSFVQSWKLEINSVLSYTYVETVLILNQALYIYWMTFII